MARGQVLFKERDVARLVRAAVKSGIKVGRVEVDKTGKITVLAAETTSSVTEGENEWDLALK